MSIERTANLTGPWVEISSVEKTASAIIMVDSNATLASASGPKSKEPVDSAPLFAIVGQLEKSAAPPDIQSTPPKPLDDTPEPGPTLGRVLAKFSMMRQYKNSTLPPTM
jgi:hypothetical protein